MFWTYLGTANPTLTWSIKCLSSYKVSVSLNLSYYLLSVSGKIPEAWNASSLADTVAYNGPLAGTGVVVTS